MSRRESGGDEDDIQTAAWMQSELGLLVNSEIARQAVATVPTSIRSIPCATTSPV
jgi:hypothetical protein